MINELYVENSYINFTGFGDYWGAIAYWEV